MRLEVYEQSASQLRLTSVQDISLANFWVFPSGDLSICTANNLTYKNVGIGCFSPLLPPKAALDVYWDQALFGSNQAQLRLTDLWNNTYTDFTTWTTGDLLINPKLAAEDRRVGINLTSIDLPTSTLDIKGDLRIRTIISNAALTDVLVVDANGLVQKRTLPNSGGVAACNLGLQNGYVTKVTDQTNNIICNSEIFDQGDYVAIGFTNNFPAKFSVKNIGAQTINTGIWAEAPVIGVSGAANGSVGGGNTIIGSYGVADGTNNVGNINTGAYGLVSTSTSTATNYGLFGLASISGAASNYGANLKAQYATTLNVGVNTLATANSNGTTNNYGVNSIANGNNSSVAENLAYKGYAYGANGTNKGVYSRGEGGDISMGVHGLALSATTSNFGTVG